MQEPLSTQEYRCHRCGRLLFKGHLKSGSSVEIPCWHRQCRYMNTIWVDFREPVAVS